MEARSRSQRVQLRHVLIQALADCSARHHPTHRSEHAHFAIEHDGKLVSRCIPPHKICFCTELRAGTRALASRALSEQIPHAKTAVFPDCQSHTTLRMDRDMIDFALLSESLSIFLLIDASLPCVP